MTTYKFICPQCSKEHNDYGRLLFSLCAKCRKKACTLHPLHMDKNKINNRYFDLRLLGHNHEEAIRYTADEYSHPIEDIKALIGNEDV